MNLNRYLAQRKRKAWLVAGVSGLIILFVVGAGLLRENPTTSANDSATATALNEVQQTWVAIGRQEPDKATQEAILELSSTPPPTLTPFDKEATEASMLTASPTAGPDLGIPVLFFQRPAGAGRLLLPSMGICGHDVKCMAKDFWMEKTKDKFIMVYAGRHFNDFTNSFEALIEVEWLSLNGRHAPIDGGGYFLTPIPAQDLTIVDAIGEQLTLRTDDGTLLVFDVPSQQYISVPQSQLTARARHPVEVGDITEESHVPFSLPGFSGFNRWSGKNGQGPLRVTVFAGVNGGNPKDFFQGTGTLAVVTSKGEPTAADLPQLYSPSGRVDLAEEAHGALWIFDVKDNLVALLDRSGNKLFFDLATRQFISMLDERPTQVFGALLFDPNMPLAQATPAPVTPFTPPTPISTPAPSAYP